MEKSDWFKMSSSQYSKSICDNTQAHFSLSQIHSYLLDYAWECFKYSQSWNQWDFVENSWEKNNCHWHKVNNCQIILTFFQTSLPCIISLLTVIYTRRFGFHGDHEPYSTPRLRAGAEITDTPLHVSRKLSDKQVQFLANVRGLPDSLFRSLIPPFFGPFCCS